MPFTWSNDLARDWKQLRTLWTGHAEVLQAQVGPLWELPLEHEVCIQFAEHHPASKAFLIEQLSDPDARVAAYAFKCLVRVTDLKRADVSEAVLARQDKITTIMRSSRDETTLGAFIARYFAAYPEKKDLLNEQARTQSWQQNELAAYKRQQAGEDKK